MLASLGITLETIAICAAICAVIAIAALTISIINNMKLRRIMKNCSTGNLDETIVTYYDNVAALSDKLEASIEKFNIIDSNMKLGIQKFAAMRYDAFNDQIGFSYSVAMLNGNNDGVVLTSIFGRNTSNNYLKIITNGECEEKLSKEEQSVVDKAIAEHTANFTK